MFDSFLIRRDSLKNNIVDGKITGFQFAVRLANYRGIFLSLVNGFYVNVDGIEYGEDVQMLEINGKPPRTLKEISKANFEHWDFQNEATLHISKENGLSPGRHCVEYLPSTMDGYGYRTSDKAWVENPPKPGAGGGKTFKPCKFDLDLQEVQ